MVMERVPEHICNSIKEAFIFDHFGVHKDRFKYAFMFDVLLEPAYSAIVLFRIQQYLFKRFMLFKNKPKKTLATNLLRRYYRRLMMIIARINFSLNAGFEASVYADVKPGLYIHHCQGVIIGGDTKIGSNCHIFKNILLGEKNGIYPILKDNITLYANSVVIGGVTLHDNVVVAPNSVVINDIPEGITVAGVPAHPIGKNKH